MSQTLPGGAPHPGRPGRPAERILVVAAGANPTLDYYITPRLAAPVNARPARVAALHDDAEALLAGPHGADAQILICRYVTSRWLAAIERHRRRIAGVTLFLDDDIAAVARDPSAPLAYRWRLWTRYLRHRDRLAPLLDATLASTPALAERLALAATTVVPPLASAADEPLARSVTAAPLRIAFHATGIHAAEHAWLAPVLREVMHRQPRLELHVVADWRTRRHWRGLPLVLAPPAAWPDYRRDTRILGADLVLAPLLATPANAVRAPTKRIDALRMGAALLTNAAGVYRPTAAEAAAGMVVPLDTQAWVERILALAADPAALARLATLNADHVRAWSAAARPLPF